MFPALLVMVLASPMAPPTKPATPAGSTARRPSITLKWSAPLKMAYREFAGAYWQTGPALRDAQAQMQQAGHLGRLFIRFLENPWSAETTTIKAQVGFIVNQGSRPVQPGGASRIEWARLCVRARRRLGAPSPGAPTIRGSCAGRSQQA